MDKNIKSVPWIPNLALSFLDSILETGMAVFEYGSGGSTLYFGKRARSVISVEHDRKWHSEISLRIPDNVNYFLIEPDDNLIGNDKSNPDHYTSGSFLMSFKSYVITIDQYNLFDIIFIDGRSRAACLAHAAKQIKPNGWIILDNAERKYYLRNTAYLFDGWESVKIFGHGPYIDWPWQTLFIRKP